MTILDVISGEKVKSVPILSIIVPIYNAEKYLQRCIDSILKQDFHDFELILVDDGSLDKSREICNDYAKSDNRIKIIIKSNGGVSSARNAALEVAAGIYVGFVDADDWISPFMYKDLHQKAVKYSADIVICDYTRNGEFVIDVNDFEIKSLAGIEYIQTMYKKLKTRDVVVWNKIYNKNLFDNIKFKEYNFNEDENIIIRLFLISNNIIYSNNIMYNYTNNTDSATNQYFSEKNIDELLSCEERVNFFRDNGLILPYKKSLNNFFKNIIIFYYKTDKYILGNEIIKNRIRKIFFHYYSEFLKNDEFKFKDRVKLYFFSKYPGLLKVYYVGKI